MATAPGKRKPPTPPKPPLGQIAGQNLTENLGNSVKERSANTVQDEGNANDVLKTKTDGTPEVATAREVSLTKCNSDKLSPKPPLLPKPQTSPKVASPVKPVVPQRPNLIPSSKSLTTSGGIASRRLPANTLHIKAPVAKLDEFDSFCESPVRPPRSPKNQQFKGEPFKVFEEKPELPVKKKQLTSNIDWQTTKEKSASLGRTNAFRFVEAKSKSASLDKSKAEEIASFLKNTEEFCKLEARTAPVPPPRQKKKPTTPVYAQVNYNLKKNRRQAAEDCSECEEMVVEGKLVLPGASSTVTEHLVNGCDKTSNNGELEETSALCVTDIQEERHSAKVSVHDTTELHSAQVSQQDTIGEAISCEIIKENSSQLYRIVSPKSEVTVVSDNLPCTNLVILREGDVNSQITEGASRAYRLSTSSLPSRKKLEMKELVKLHRRRQSWSNSKDDSPSPEKMTSRVPNVQKRKSKSRSWWCDDGELSSGALGDLDSSDNAARQSSFEEVSWTGSDIDDEPSAVRSKLSCWFGSFGKGNRKHKTRKDSNSQFYCDEVDGSRPPSGLSALSALEVDQKSEESLESENEGDTTLEDGDLSQCHTEELQDKKAFYIAQELMTSERVFIDVLKLLSEDFRKAVHKVSSEQKYSVIPEADLCRILNSLPQLQSLNEDLLRDLENRIENWNSVKKIADVIVRKGPFLKLYTSYIQNFESQCSFLEESCQKYPRFAKVVKEFEATPRCQKLSLKHYMLKPVQRIPQYRLLLEDYLHHLSPSSPDLEDTKTALKIVCDVADHANRSIKLGDHLSKLLQLQSQLGNYEIIKPGRMFLKDGELLKLSRKGRQPRYFILLNDCLLYTSYYGTVQSSGLKVNYELPLNSMKVNIPQAEDYHNEFSIISIKRSFTLSARSLNERQEWVDALQKAITDYTSRQLSFQNVKITPAFSTEDSCEPLTLGQEAPVWIQDRRVTMCQSCTAEFTVTFRRHHCRACGKVVCGDCSDFRAPLQYMRFQSARVCEECHDTLLKEARDPASKLYLAMKHELGHAVRITDTFKRLGPASGKKIKKFIPQRLKEVTANDADSQISGWLQRRSRRSWKRLWFVLKEQVLYVYKASEDVVALESIPVLGYAVEPMKERHFQLYEGIDAKLVFQLAHPGQHPLIFHADSEHLTNRWIAAMNEATVLK